jgi:hypothetical protein
MAYAGPASRGKRARDAEPISASGPAAERTGYVRQTALRPLDTYKAAPAAPAIFAAGVALGIVLGAGAALLFAPQSGADTRRGIIRRGRRLGRRSRDAWSDLADELRDATRRTRRRMRRKRERAAEDE